MTIPSQKCFRGFQNRQELLLGRYTSGRLCVCSTLFSTKTFPGK